MSQQEPDNNQNNQASPALALGISIGLAVGTSIGLLIDNLAMGIGVGVAVGLAIGAGLQNRQSRKYPMSHRACQTGYNRCNPSL